MTNQQQFDTAAEAEAWLRANPMRELWSYREMYKVRYCPKKEDFEAIWPDGGNQWMGYALSFTNDPYTVIPQANKTITINGKQYREGDILAGSAGWAPNGLIVELVPDPNKVACRAYKIECIPDELADKPKEPKTLTLEEVDGERTVHVLHPVDNDFLSYSGELLETYYALKAHLDNGGNLYSSREDAELGKALGWK